MQHEQWSKKLSGIQKSFILLLIPGLFLLSLSCVNTGSSEKTPRTQKIQLLTGTKSAVCHAFIIFLSAGGSELHGSYVRIACWAYHLTVPASEPSLCLLKVVLQKHVQGSHAVPQSQRQVWPRAPAEPKQTHNADDEGENSWMCWLINRARWGSDVFLSKRAFVITQKKNHHG